MKNTYDLKDGPSPLKTLKLFQETVDEEYKRETVTKRASDFFNWLKANVSFQRGEVHVVDKEGREKQLSVIPASLSEITKKHKEQFGSHRFTVIMWTRMLWKAGLLYRFYEGEWQGYRVYKGTDKEVQGSKWGVRYLW